MHDAHPATDAAARAPLLKRLAREPLVHFLLLGLALFAVYRAFNRGAAVPVATRIVLNADDVKRLEDSWTALWQRAPTDQELNDLIENEVREEILYREALALGLDKGDTIVRRRLVQKMEFLAEDTPLVHDPDPAELKAWFEQNRARFELPPRVTFRQVFFSFYKRQDKAREDAETAMDDLSGHDSATGEEFGDRIMFQARYQDQSQEDASQAFGAKFAEALFALAAGAWEGPIESAYGWHLVRVESFAPRGAPAFETIEPQVKYEWLADQRAEGRRQAYLELRRRYQVVLPPEHGK